MVMGYIFVNIELSIILNRPVCIGVFRHLHNYVTNSLFRLASNQEWLNP